MIRALQVSRADQLAFALQHLQPPQLDEAITFYRVACALRPQSPGAHSNLSVALLDRGRLAEGIADKELSALLARER